MRGSTHRDTCVFQVVKYLDSLLPDQGDAHASLEQYEAAREAYLEALSIDTGDAAAAAGLRDVSAAMAADALDPNTGDAAAAPHSPTSPAAIQKRQGCEHCNFTLEPTEHAKLMQRMPPPRRCNLRTCLRPYRTGLCRTPCHTCNTRCRKFQSVPDLLPRESAGSAPVSSPVPARSAVDLFVVTSHASYALQAARRGATRTTGSARRASSRCPCSQMFRLDVLQTAHCDTGRRGRLGVPALPQAAVGAGRHALRPHVRFSKRSSTVGRLHRLPICVPALPLIPFPRVSCVPGCSDAINTPPPITQHASSCTNALLQPHDQHTLADGHAVIPLQVLPPLLPAGR